MAQDNNKDTSLTVLEHLDKQAVCLEALIPSNGKGKSTLIYIAALMVAFVGCYGCSNIAHSIKIKQNANPDVTVHVSDADDLIYENAYQNYQRTSLGNDISSSKNGGYTLSINEYTAVPNADNTATIVTSAFGSYQIIGNKITGLNAANDMLYYVLEDGLIHCCNALDGTNDMVLAGNCKASHLIVAEGYLFYIDSHNGNCLTRCAIDGSDLKVVSHQKINSYVILGGDLIYMTENEKLYRSSNVMGDVFPDGELIAENISDFQYNGDIIALNAGNLISFEVDKTDYKELIMDQTVTSLAGAAYQHVYYTENGALYDLNTDDLTSTQITDNIGVVLSIDNIDNRIFATRKVRNGDYYTYDNQYLN